MQKHVTEFHKRFYYWAVQDWEREVSQNFPFLKSLGEVAAQNVITTLHRTELNSFFKAMVKRVTNRQFLLELGESTSDKDKEYQNKYMEQWRLAGFSDPMYIKSERAIRDKIILPDFKKEIIRALAMILSNDYRDIENGLLWEYQTTFKKWNILTRIEIGDDNYQLAYSHSIVSIDDGLILDHYSILRWLGISSGTEWYGVTNTERGELVKTFRKLISHFLNEVQKILKEIS